jgi:hypothetical protein
MVWVLNSGRGKKFLSFQNVQTGSVAHQVSYSVGTGVKRPGREADHAPVSSADVKNGGNC